MGHLRILSVTWDTTVMLRSHFRTLDDLPRCCVCIPQTMPIFCRRKERALLVTLTKRPEFSWEVPKRRKKQKNESTDPPKFRHAALMGDSKCAPQFYHRMWYSLTKMRCALIIDGDRGGDGPIISPR